MVVVQTTLMIHVLQIIRCLLIWKISLESAFDYEAYYSQVCAIVFLIGGPSGSGKTSLARKMANIVGCEVVSLESYHRSEQVKDFKYDDFSSLDLTLLSKV